MNYSELVALLPGYIGRPNDSDITTKAPTFIALFEAKVNRRLRTRRQVTRTTISPSSETLAVPSDFAGLKNLRLSDDPEWQLEAVSSERIADAAASTTTSGNPQMVALEGENFVFWPAPTEATDMVLVYYARVPALTEAASTNWLADDHPDVYLYGMALEAALYLVDSEMISTFAQLLTTAVDDVQASYVNEAADRLTSQSTVI